MFLVVPNNWKGIPSFPQQLEKNHEISPQCGMRPFPLQHLESKPMFSLEPGKEARFPLAIQEVLHDTRRHLGFPQQMEKSPMFTASS